MVIPHFCRNKTPIPPRIRARTVAASAASSEIDSRGVSVKVYCPAANRIIHTNIIMIPIDRVKLADRFFMATPAYFRLIKNPPEWRDTSGSHSCVVECLGTSFQPFEHALVGDGIA